MNRWLGRLARWSGALADQAFIQTIRLPLRTDAADLDQVSAADAIAHYSALSAADAYFVPPSQVPRIYTESTSRLQPHCLDLKWNSSFVPVWAGQKENYAKQAANRSAYARLWQQGRPTPTVIYVHGFRGGNFTLEERYFPVQRFYAGGANVAFFQLPFHGRRATEGTWPALDLVRTNEGMAQAIYDLRCFIDWLRHERGSDRIAVVGVSLGGYIAALLATVCEFEFVAAVAPVSDLFAMIKDLARNSTSYENLLRIGVTEDRWRAATSWHDPFERRPCVSGRNAMVFIAREDAVVPRTHAEKLAAHLGCDVQEFSGGHLLQWDRMQCYDAIVARLTDLGWF